MKIQAVSPRIAGKKRTNQKRQTFEFTKYTVTKETWKVQQKNAHWTAHIKLNKFKQYFLWSIRCCVYLARASSRLFAIVFRLFHICVIVLCFICCVYSLCGAKKWLYHFAVTRVCFRLHLVRFVYYTCDSMSTCIQYILPHRNGLCVSSLGGASRYFYDMNVSFSYLRLCVCCSVHCASFSSINKYRIYAE